MLSLALFSSLLACPGRPEPTLLGKARAPERKLCPGDAHPSASGGNLQEQEVLEDLQGLEAVGPNGG